MAEINIETLSDIRPEDMNSFLGLWVTCLYSPLAGPGVAVVQQAVMGRMLAWQILPGTMLIAFDGNIHIKVAPTGEFKLFAINNEDF